MSHTVTVTRTTTTTTTSAVLVNIGYLKTVPGLLKLGELVFGAACVGLVGYYIHKYSSTFQTELFFLLIATACLMATFCLLVSCLLSISTASILPKTLFEIIFHGLAFILYLVASILLLVQLNKYKNSYYQTDYNVRLTAAIIGMIVTAMYLGSVIFAFRTYKRT